MPQSEHDKHASWLGQQRPARDITWKLFFGEENGHSVSEHPFTMERDWLKQWCDPPASGFFLVECVNEDAPIRIWHSERNHIDALYTCIYEDLA